LVGSGVAGGVGLFLTGLKAANTALVPAARAADAAGSAVAGGVALDSFAGSDDAKLASALSYIAQQTYRPTLLLANRLHQLSNTYDLFEGLSISGVGLEREFARQTVVQARGSALFRVPAGQTNNMVKDVTIQNISFVGSASTSFLEPVELSSGPILAYSTIRACGFKLFSTVIQGRLLGVTLQDIYINQGYKTQLYLAGSDNFIGVGGHFFMDSQNLSADQYLLRFAHMSRTDVGPLFITGTRATGIRVDNGYGITFSNTKSEAKAGDPSIATQGSAVVVTGGHGVVFRDCWFFNVMANPTATGTPSLHKGYITVTGGDGVLIAGCRFSGGATFAPTNTPANTPCVYASGGSVLCRSNLAINGQALLYRQATAGLINADAAVTTG